MVGCMADPFRVQCAHCKEAIVIMSDLDPSQPRTVPPDKGDAVQCPKCGLLSLVQGVQDNHRVHVCQLEEPTRQALAIAAGRRPTGRRQN